MFGLGLLTLDTLKLFIVDLASVDVSYRVLSFIGVGLVLLGIVVPRDQAALRACWHRRGAAGVGGPRSPVGSAC